MRYFLIILALSIGLLFAPHLAFAQVCTQTVVYTPDGKMLLCTTCTVGGQTTTYCQ